MRIAVFSLPGFEQLAPRGPGATLSACSVERFPNGELHLRIDTEVEGRDCVLVGSAAPPDERLLALTLAAHTLAREGAASVRGLLPYVGYARQDRPERGLSLGAAWVGELLRASAIDGVVTVDVHSKQATRLLPMPITSLSSASVFGPAILALGLEELTVVAPDEGAVDRCEELRAATGIEAPVAWLAKRRVPEGTTHVGLHGELSRRAVVTDDILDTGGTLVSCCRTLTDAGVGEITILVTHGLFTGEGWREILGAGATRVFTTDSVPGRAPLDPRVEVLPIRPLLEQWLASSSVVCGGPDQQPAPITERDRTRIVEG